MRNNGGFILIKINKDLGDITADDFDKKIFRDLFINKIRKPLVLETLNIVISFSSLSITSIGFGYLYQTTQCEDDLSSISGYTEIGIGYNSTTDEVTWAYTDV